MQAGSTDPGRQGTIGGDQETHAARAAKRNQVAGKGLTPR
jgi:hypothetical protein